MLKQKGKAAQGETEVVPHLDGENVFGLGLTPRRLFEALGVKGKRVLEVGHQENYEPSLGAALAGAKEVAGMTFFDPASSWKMPGLFRGPRIQELYGKIIRIPKNGKNCHMREYFGDFLRVGAPDSPLKGERFDAVLFWGSLKKTGEGNKKDAGHVMALSRGADGRDARPPLPDRLVQQGMLECAKGILAPGGRVIVVSGNFAGSNADATEPAVEKPYVAEAALHSEILEGLGAKRIRVYGESRPGFRGDGRALALSELGCPESGVCGTMRVFSRVDAVIAEF
ncbi:MAG: hypothetical protein PHF51_01155 [Candidatus ainarchaeum sp.]|nr:hypothetical protein [Candidatus ainarchaeum sp.]